MFRGGSLGFRTIPAVLTLAVPGTAQRLLVPMDRQQRDHLKAYGLTHWALTQDLRAEWLLNYRDGSFLLPDDDRVLREAALRTARFADAPQVQDTAVQCCAELTTYARSELF